MPSNAAADALLRRLGHKCVLRVLPGGHAWHGMPVNWFRFAWADWRKSALPATILRVGFFLRERFDERTHLAAQDSQVMLPDYSPLVVFPAFLLLLPALLVAIVRSALSVDETTT